MKLVIHGARGSGSSIVEAACAEIGVDYEVRDLDVRAEEHRASTYADLNPQRKLPTLEIEGEIMTETVAILITLDERHPQARLLPPPGSKPRAQALRWLSFMACELYPIMEIIDFPLRFASEGEALRERALTMWRERWLVVERSFTGSPYHGVGGFSVTDIYIAVLSRWDLPEAWRCENLPKVEALATEVRARPAIAPIWARHFG